MITYSPGLDDPYRAALRVSCPAPLCAWRGLLHQTDDQDVLDADFNTIGRACVCPRCGAEVVTDPPAVPAG